jgi:glyoxylase-like metal-dependent hydrolase (beta-lactamase superfamily II)
VRGRLFSLPDDTLVYPAHDYDRRRITTIGQEKARNPRLGGERTLEEFVKLMSELKLAYPNFIDYAVPGNRDCGTCPSGVPEHLQEYCAQMEASRQG